MAVWRENISLLWRKHIKGADGSSAAPSSAEQQRVLADSRARAEVSGLEQLDWGAGASLGAGLGAGLGGLLVVGWTERSRCKIIGFKRLMGPGNKLLKEFERHGPE